MWKKTPAFLAVTVLAGVLVVFVLQLNSGTSTTSYNEKSITQKTRTDDDSSVTDLKSSMADDTNERKDLAVVMEQDLSALGENPTKEDLEEYARQRRLAKAEAEGRLDEQLRKEQELADMKEAQRLEREQRREEAHERDELRKEYRRQVREARENGEEPPEMPAELRKPTKEERRLLKEQRKQERDERNMQRELERTQEP